MLIRIITVTSIISFTAVTSEPSSHNTETPVAIVTPVLDEVEVEYAPDVVVIALHDEAEFEFIPAAE